MQLVWTEIAETDLDAIVSYIADESVSNAVAFDARVRDRVRMLSDFPEVGRVGRVGRFEGTLELIIPHDRCLVVYRLHDKQVQVLRVIHGGQEWPLTFELPRA
jgi:toxin ParE1/3/4